MKGPIPAGPFYGNPAPAPRLYLVSATWKRIQHRILCVASSETEALDIAREHGTDIPESAIWIARPFAGRAARIAVLEVP